MGRSFLSPTKTVVSPSLQPFAYAKGLEPSVNSNGPPRIVQPRTSEPVAVAPPRAPVEALGKLSTYKNWRVPASSGLSPSPLPGDEPTTKVTQGGQPVPDGGRKVGGFKMTNSRDVAIEHAMEATPATHKDWVPFIHLYFCVLFIIVMILVLYLAIAIKQGSEVTTSAPTNLPSYYPARPLPNVTGDEYQHTGEEGLTLNSEVAPVSVVVVVEEGDEASVRFVSDDKDNHDVMTQLRQKNQEATATASEKNVTDVHDTEPELKSFETLMPRLCPEFESTATKTHSNVELIHVADGNTSLS
ncbi:hypothetical protein MRX96_036247 [Rhipicephalus microplus]